MTRFAMGVFQSTIATALFVITSWVNYPSRAEAGVLDWPGFGVGIEVRGQGGTMDELEAKLPPDSVGFDLIGPKLGFSASVGAYWQLLGAVWTGEWFALTENRKRWDSSTYWSKRSSNHLLAALRVSTLNGRFVTEPRFGYGWRSEEVNRDSMSGSFLPASRKIHKAEGIVVGCEQYARLTGLFGLRAYYTYGNLGKSFDSRLRAELDFHLDYPPKP